MTSLNRKLRRDLLTMKGQVVAICLVMGCGVATFVMCLTALRSLQASQSIYYQQYRFADVFVHVKRAPETLAQQFREIPGVNQVQTRIVADVTLDVPDMAEPAVGRFISVPEVGRPKLNDLHLREGRYIEPNRAGEVMVGEAFAQAHHIRPGDTIRAILNGRLQTMRIVGIVLSPEYVLSIQNGLSLPDDRGFGVFWMGYDGLAAAFDMDGAFNDLTLTLTRGANEAEVIRRIDRLTARYGGVGAYGRSDQISNRFLSDEMRALRGMGLIVPIIFLAVAAFLLNVVMSRLIHTQREQVAALKAFGYTRVEVGVHYLKFVLVIGVIGGILGIGAGLWLGRGMTELYARFYRFPTFQFVIDPATLELAVLVAAGAAVLGTLGAVARAIRLPPAEAMRPEPPATYRPTLVERLGLQRLFTQPARMVMRQLERRPLKAALSVLGIATAVAILVMGNFVTDALDYMIEFGFYTQQRQDVLIHFFEPASLSALHEVQHLPGVIEVQPVRSVSVRISSANRSRRTGIIGLPANPQLLRVIDQQMHPVNVPPQGLLLSDKLAEVLEVKPGQSVWIEVMEGRREVKLVPVAGTVKEYAGMNIYMDLDALRRLLREGDTLSGAFLSVDARKLDALYRQLKQTPQISAVEIKAAAVKGFNETQGQNQRQIQFFNVIFAMIIAAGVVYNTARISLSERSRELATLRVIGFTRTEISAILLGELAVLTLAALPVGMVLGYGFAMAAAKAFESESYRIPVVVSGYTYGFAAVVVIAAAIVSGLMVRKKLDHLDLVAVLKSKE